MNDRDLIIRTVIGEAANQSPEGQRAVAHVILNRLKDDRWGNSVKDVVFQKHQFEPWTTRRSELMAIPTNSPKYQEVAALVDDLGDDPTNGATHFLNEQIVRDRRNGSLPKWADKMADSRQVIGDHTFLGGKTPQSQYFLSTFDEKPQKAAGVSNYFLEGMETFVSRKSPKAPDGLDAPGPPTFLDRAGEWVTDAAQGVKDTVLGDAEFDVPEVSGSLSAVNDLAGRGGIDQSEVTRRLFAAQDEEAMGVIIQNIAPGTEIVKDNRGHLYADINGKRFALDKSGLSGRDVDELIKGIGFALATISGAKVGQALMGTAGRITGAGGGAGGEQTLEQMMSNMAGDERGIELVPIAIAATFGLGGEVAGTALEYLGPKVWRQIFGEASESQTVEELSGRLEGIGISAEEIGAAIQSMDADRTARDLGDEALARIIEAKSLPVPIDLTAGQATRNPALFSMEDAARSTDVFGRQAQREARGLSLAQQGALLDNAGMMVPDQSGREARGRRVQDALVAKRDRAKSRVDQAYDLAREHPDQPTIAMPTMVEFIEGVDKHLNHEFFVDPDGVYSRVVNRFRSLISDDGASLRDLEQWRSAATRAREHSKGADSAAIGALIREYDTASESTLLGGATGDKEAVKLWRRAVRERAEFGRRYQQNDIIGKLTRDARDRRGEMEIDPADAMSELLGASLGKKGATREVLRLKRFLGEESQEWVAVQSEAMVRLLDFTPNDGLRDGKIRQNIVNNFRQVREKYPGLLENVFTQPQLRALRRFSDVVETINIPPRTAGDVNSSGSGKFAIQAGTRSFERVETAAEALGRFFGTAGRIVAGQAVKMVTGARNRAEADAMLRSIRGLPPVPPPSAAFPGVGGALGAEAGHSTFGDIGRPTTDR